VIFRRKVRRWAKERREFVYLDEASVTSLIASRDGAIKDTVKETLTRSTEGEFKTGGSSTGKKLGLSAEARVKKTNTSGQEVVRKAVIQSTFRDLRTGGDDELLTTVDRKRRRREIEPRSLATVRDVMRHKRKLRNHGQLLCVADIKRGDVLELTVNLSAERTYQLATALSSVVDLVNGREDLFGIDKSQYDQIFGILEVIDGMLVGLVPIHGTSTDFAILTIDGEEHLLHRSLVDPNGDLLHHLKLLEVVGVTNFASYTRDLRRVLFAGESYTTYVRIESATLRDSWQPVKLATVLEKTFLKAGDLFTRLTEVLADAAENADVDPAPTPTPVDWEDATLRFGRALAAECATSLEEPVLQAAATMAAVTLAAATEIEQRRSAFDDVANTVAPGADRETVRRVRDPILHQATASAAQPSAPVSRQPAGTEQTTRKLEVEFVAIYW